MRTLVTTAVLFVLTLGVLAVCVLFGPTWITGGDPGLTAAERLKAQNDARQ